MKNYDVPIKEYKDWLDSRTKLTIGMVLMIRSTIEKASNQPFLKKVSSYLLILKLSKFAEIIDRVCTSYSRESAMMALLMDKNVATINVHSGHEFFTGENIAIRIYESYFGEVYLEKPVS